MTTSDDAIQINLNFWQGEDQSRINTLKLLLTGYSNNAIASELSFSLKNIESIISKLFRRCGIITRGPNSSLINPRAKLLVHGVSNDWLRYQILENSASLDFLTRNQYLTLVLSAAGCSNRAIADFLCISSKTVESRLNSLFHQFAINMQFDRQANPRMKLIVSAIRRGFINNEAIGHAASLLDVEKWQEVLSNREQIKDEFLRYQLGVNKSHILPAESNFSLIYNKAVQVKEFNPKENSYIQAGFDGNWG